MLARSSDNKDRWVLLLDPATGKTRVLVALHDDAWANGPGAFTLGWLPDNRRVYFESEQDGFAHLYTISIDANSTPVQLTRGAFEVSDVRLSVDKTKFYFTSSEVSFAERHLYSLPTAGGAPVRLTSMPGNNAATISPDDALLAVVNSYSNKPPELYLQGNTTASTARVQVTTSPIPEFFTHNWIDPPLVSIRARDGQTIHARLYKPQGKRARRSCCPPRDTSDVHNGGGSYTASICFISLDGARHSGSTRLRGSQAKGATAPGIIATWRKD